MCFENYCFYVYLLRNVFGNVFCFLSSFFVPKFESKQFIQISPRKWLFYFNGNLFKFDKIICYTFFETVQQCSLRLQATVTKFININLKGRCPVQSETPSPAILISCSQRLSPRQLRQDCSHIRPTSTLQGTVEGMSTVAREKGGRKGNKMGARELMIIEKSKEGAERKQIHNKIAYHLLCFIQSSVLFSSV